LLVEREEVSVFEIKRVLFLLAINPLNERLGAFTTIPSLLVVSIEVIVCECIEIATLLELGIRVGTRSLDIPLLA
jgi:hypothetical protein